MIKRFCDKCKEEMLQPHAKVIDQFNQDTYEVCAKCAAKIFNIIGVKAASEMVATLQKFPENEEESNEDKG